MGGDYNRVDNYFTRTTELSHKARLGKFFRILAIASLFVPLLATACSASAQEGENSEGAKTSELFDNGGEFDPTLGGEITTRNGRALLIVHEGFLGKYDSDNYANDEDYELYLTRRLPARKALFENNGDPIVVVVDQSDLDDGSVTLEPLPNTLYYITEGLSGRGAPNFVYQRVSYSQNAGVEESQKDRNSWGKGIWDILKEAGVTEIEVAGERRSACPYYIATVTLAENDFVVGWCEDCAFPLFVGNDEAERARIYPTLEPIDNGQ